ncbi:hypothetical protein [Flavobacterium sp. 5]|uniref:hypothetical protein n=1 Tax=Flavobacterium sp. 5 TaxID=2035199 RepID=UPI000C2C1E9E|nr:hypothetical protein [Flavobacterium sp. 5]PKB18393.1 hypothetical protein CLU82_3668 [Flavobacterium sp. 5]
MKYKKKYRLLKKRLDQLELIVKPNSLTLTDENDNNHTVILKINSQGNFENYHERIKIENQKEIITQETNL